MYHSEHGGRGGGVQQQHVTDNIYIYIYVYVCCPGEEYSACNKVCMSP